MLAAAQREVVVKTPSVWRAEGDIMLNPIQTDTPSLGKQVWQCPISVGDGAWGVGGRVSQGHHRFCLARVEDGIDCLVDVFANDHNKNSLGRRLGFPDDLQNDPISDRSQ